MGRNMMTGELYHLLLDHLGTESAVERWLDKENPLLNGLTPYHFVYTGQIKKLLHFVQTQLESEREL